MSGGDDVAAAFRAAGEAVVALRDVPVENIARFLEDYAARIEAYADTLIERAARETGLPQSPRLRSVELPRTTNQLRQGAAAARDRSWCAATIDSKANLRSYYGPLGGPVVVFGPNNFPFAFNSVAGGDFVAAIAAGNPVIGKANTGHPGTTRLLASAGGSRRRARRGCRRGWCSSSTGRRPTSASSWCRTRRSGATGFTGSKNAGLKLKQAADAAGKPIYLEMSSTNPVFVLPGALRRAIGRRRQGAVRFVRDGRRAVLHAARAGGRSGGERTAKRSSPSWRGCSPAARRARCWARRGARRSPRRWTSW